MERQRIEQTTSRFCLTGTVDTVAPLGEGLINDTYLITTQEETAPDYVLQRINHHVFQDVEMLQHNIETVTNHIREKLARKGIKDLDRRVLRFIPTDNGKTYYHDKDSDSYWRVSVFIPRSHTQNQLTPVYAHEAGVAFGQFESMLTDVAEPLGETIPSFHNMELRVGQLQEAAANDLAGRVKETGAELDYIGEHAEEMCKAERLFREGTLPKRICHCDTKVNNMLFDEDGTVLCVIDLDTVMPSFVFSDYGDFLRTAANSVAEDSPEYGQIAFRKDIFEAFTKGYLSETKTFLTEVEREMLPFAVAMFPMMQAVRFLADYLNGDTYYKTQYPTHNLVRTRNQLQFFKTIQTHHDYLRKYIDAWS